MKVIVWTRESLAEYLHIAGCMYGEGMPGCTFDLCPRPTDADFWLRLADEVLRLDAERMESQRRPQVKR